VLFGLLRILEAVDAGFLPVAIFFLSTEIDQ
jgi:hypothetical protein